MKDLTKEPCCNTCKHSSLHYSDTNRSCEVDTNPYKEYFGGHRPDYLCDKFEPIEWFSKKED